jgi:hypothetical protein
MKQIKEAMHVLRNFEARFCNYCCSGKAMIITHPVCVWGGG